MAADAAQGQGGALAEGASAKLASAEAASAQVCCCQALQRCLSRKCSHPSMQISTS